jgi:rhodanese-related sulfurtransferase
MSFNSMTVEEVSEFLALPGAIVLDHRDASSHAKAHIPGAKPVDDQIILEIVRKYRQAPVLVYCYHGISSQDIATMLVNFGCTNVSSLEGGWQAWSTYQNRQTATYSNGLEKWLFDQGFELHNINSRISNGNSALMQAAMLAENLYVNELIRAGININLLNDDENNALWFACVSEDIAIINNLIEQGINLDNSNVNGATCLIYAASAGKFEVVKTLVEAGANVNHTTLDGFNALDSASTYEILRYLKPQYIAA